MLVRRIILIILTLGLLLVATVPVEAAPAMQKGAHSSYSLDLTISFVQACETLGTSTTPGDMIVCPVAETIPASTNVSGSIGWSVTDVTSTTASLNVTHDLSISRTDSNPSSVTRVGSFNESIDLATRLVSLFPSMMPEMDQFLQTAQATASISPSGINLTSSMASLESTMPQRSLHTMWWVNGPLKLNEIVPVLVLPTNVTRSSRVDLGGSIGSRDAWNLEFNFSRPMIVPDSSAALGSLLRAGVDAGFVFNYDNSSDLLLSANAELHLGFEDAIPIAPSPCVPSASMMCPATSSPLVILANFRVSVEASLKLVDTTVDLSQRMPQTSPPQPGGGSDGGNGSGTNNGSGSNGDSNVAGAGSSGNLANGSSQQPSSPTSRPGVSAQATISSSWVYAIFGVLAVAIVGLAAWVSRRRSKKSNMVRTSTQSRT